MGSGWGEKLLVRTLATCWCTVGKGAVMGGCENGANADVGAGVLGLRGDDSAPCSVLSAGSVARRWHEAGSALLLHQILGSGPVLVAGAAECAVSSVRGK
jgi:hypothetical protein